MLWDSTSSVAKEIKCLFIFDEFFDQGRLSDTAPSIDHNKAAIPAEFLFQRIQFFFSSDKSSPVPHLSDFDSFMINHIMIILFILYAVF